MKTVSEIVDWLNTEDHVKCILIDILDVGNATNTSFYFSTMPYADVTNNIVYNACVQGGINFSESLSIDGQPSLSFGSLEISNVGGIHDSYLEYVWAKRPIKIYLGDPSWQKSDFVLIFDGLIQELLAPSESSLSFSLFDKLQRLNDPITETTLASTQYSQNTLETILPLLFGECFNITPLLVDNGSTQNGGQVYMINNGPINGIIEVRDNGIPIPVELDAQAGTFELLSRPYGTITCSAQGQTPYTNTIAGIITKLVTEYGTPENRFTTNDINFSTFSNTSAVGLYCQDRKNILEACNELAKSVQANLICPAITVTDNEVSTSKLRLVEIKPPTGTAKYILDDNVMIENTLSITELFPVKPSIKLAYCKNYTTQATVAAGLNPQINFKDEFIFVSSENTSQKINYRDSGTVSEEQTLLLTTQQAQVESDKRLALWQTQRYIVTAEYLPQLMFVQLGDIVLVKSSRFNLSAGKLGLVYSISRDWITGLVTIGVLV